MPTVAEHFERANAIFDAEIRKARLQGVVVGFLIGVLAALAA